MDPGPRRWKNRLLPFQANFRPIGEIVLSIPPLLNGNQPNIAFSREKLLFFKSGVFCVISPARDATGSV